jgi:hypothetical protein
MRVCGRVSHEPPPPRVLANLEKRFLVYRQCVSMRAIHPGLALALAAATANASPQRPDVNPFSGAWSGGGRFTSDAGASACEYSGPAEPASVSLTLEPESAPTGGYLSLDLPAAGATCPAFKARYRIEEVRLSGNSLMFSDAAGNEWHLTLRDGHLKGMAFSSHFSGEVDLGPGISASSPSPTPSPVPGTASPAAAGAKAEAPKASVWKGVGGVVAANIVGAGAFIGLNAALKDSKAISSNTQTCSIRSCVTAGPGDCQCNTNIASGASCGSTSAGAPYAAACNPPSLPCQSDLSCNNLICEDKFGRCPF